MAPRNSCATIVRHTTAARAIRRVFHSTALFSRRCDSPQAAEPLRSWRNFGYVLLKTNKLLIKNRLDSSGSDFNASKRSIFLRLHYRRHPPKTRLRRNSFLAFKCNGKNDLKEIFWACDRTFSAFESHRFVCRAGSALVRCSVHRETTAEPEQGRVDLRRMAVLGEVFWHSRAIGKRSRRHGQGCGGRT